MAEKSEPKNRRRTPRQPRQPAPLTGPSLPVNAGVADWYAGKLERLAGGMTRAANRAVHDLAAAPASHILSSQGQAALGGLRQRLAARFERVARDLALSMLGRADRAAAASLGASLEAMAGAADRAALAQAAPGGLPKAAVNPRAGKADSKAARSLKELAKKVTLKAEFSPTVRAALEGAVERNVELINSIPSKYFGEVQEAVISSMTEGQGLKDLVPKLEKIGGITRERARFIALDQTRKAHKAASVQKMQEAGLRKFRWVHESVSAEPRAYHKDAWRADGAGGLNGGIFELSNPPVIDLGTGERGYPGDLINCRCRMEPVIELEEAEAL